jgi:hypothetical protein
MQADVRDGSFPSILPCPISRPLSTTPDSTTPDRDPSACRLPAPDRQITGRAAAEQGVTSSIAATAWQNHHCQSVIMPPGQSLEGVTTDAAAATGDVAVTSAGGALGLGPGERQTLIREGGIRTTRPSTTAATALPARLWSSSASRTACLAARTNARGSKRNSPFRRRAVFLLVALNAP